jgi:hypothetical protein
MLKFKCCVCGKEIENPMVGQFTCRKKFCKKKYLDFYALVKRKNLKTFKTIEKKEDEI